MPRKKRERSPVGVYHWIARGINRKKLFYSSDDFGTFLALLFEHSSDHKIAVYHYCLMDNHIHLLINAQEVKNMELFSHFVKRRFAYYHSRKYKVTGPTFERMYRSKAVKEDIYLLECARYIERNPLRAGLVKKPGEYPYSSFKFYANGEPDKLITKSPAYLSLSDEEKTRQQLYIEYISSSRHQEEYADKRLLGF